MTDLELQIDRTQTRLLTATSPFLVVHVVDFSAAGTRAIRSQTLVKTNSA